MKKGAEIVTNDQVEGILIKSKATKKVSGAKAVGSCVLVEMLSAEEAAGSHLYLPGQSHQAYVLDIGPALETDKWGLKKGCRVLMQGNYVPLPNMRPGRELAIVDPYVIKCVLLED